MEKLTHEKKRSEILKENIQNYKILPENIPDKMIKKYISSVENAMQEYSDYVLKERMKEGESEEKKECEHDYFFMGMSNLEGVGDFQCFKCSKEIKRPVI